MKRYGNRQKTSEIKEKICIVVALGTIVNTKRKGNALQDYKKAVILVWKDQPEKKFSKYILSLGADRRYWKPQRIKEETRTHPIPSG